MSRKNSKAPSAGLSEVFDAGVSRTTQAQRRPGVATRTAKLAGLGVIAGAVVAAGLLPAAAVGIAATGAVHNEWENQPSTIPAPSLPGRTKLLTADGKKVAEVFSTNRVPVAAEQQGTWIRKAVVAVEDARFYKHSGVDPIGTVRALVATGGGDSVQGGSTITQQYAKNLRLTQAAIEAGGEATEQTRDALTERSWKRKIAEAHLATLIEKTTSKEDILTGYLNVGYFGSGAYGVQSAARRYYSTDATQLTL